MHAMLPLDFISERHHPLVIQGEYGIQCMPCSPQIISEMLPEIHTMEKCDFLKPRIHSQII